MVREKSTAGDLFTATKRGLEKAHVRVSTFALCWLVSDRLTFAEQSPCTIFCAVVNPGPRVALPACI